LNPRTAGREELGTRTRGEEDEKGEEDWKGSQKVYIRKEKFTFESTD